MKLWVAPESNNAAPLSHPLAVENSSGTLKCTLAKLEDVGGRERALEEPLEGLSIIPEGYLLAASKMFRQKRAQRCSSSIPGRFWRNVQIFHRFGRHPVDTCRTRRAGRFDLPILGNPWRNGRVFRSSDRDLILLVVDVLLQAQVLGEGWLRLTPLG